MTTTVEAIYEQGVLRLKEPISLAEGRGSRRTSAYGFNSFECADQSALWSVASCHGLYYVPQQRGARPPLTKAATGRRTPKS